MRLDDGRLVELASGVDALYMSGRGELSQALLGDLARWREAAAEQGAPLAVVLGDEPVLVSARNFGRYPYRVQHRHGLIGFTESASLPAVRVQPLSEHLHAAGPASALAWWADWLDFLVGGVRLTASRLDVHADWHGWNLDAGQRRRFVCRAAVRVTREDGEEFTGFEFGRRTTGTVSARIYDKSRQVAEKGGGWWPLVWGERYEPDRQVLRVEFELGREGLRGYGVDTAQEALDAAPGIWGAVTEEWLTHRTPSGDATRSRWPISEQWATIQGATFRGDVPGLSRIRQYKNAADVLRLLPGLTGYLSSFGGLTGAYDLDAVLDLLPGAIRDYGLRSGTSFAERLERKRLGTA